MSHMKQVNYQWRAQVWSETDPQIQIFADWFSHTRGSECISNSTVEMNSDTLM